VAARLAALPVRRDQQQRFRLRPGRDRASRHRVSHRPRERRSHAARRADTAAHAPDPHDTDIPSENILVAFNNPSALHVYRVNKDFTPGEEVKQPGAIDAGIFAHQVRVTPDNRLAIW